MVDFSSVDWLAQSCFRPGPGSRSPTPSPRSPAPVPRAPEPSLASSPRRPTPSPRGPGAERRGARRPHVPCMVQPAPPTLGQSHLQSKTPRTDRDGDRDRDREPLPAASPESRTSDYSSGEEVQAGLAAPGLRRGRTKFSRDQVRRLEKIFLKYRYVDLVKRVKTAEKLGLKETQVRTWFQNRRMRMKRALRGGPDPRSSPRPLAPAPLFSRPPFGSGQRVMYCQLPVPVPVPVPVPWLQTLLRIPTLYCPPGP